jgi:hypothetical protein
MPTADANFAAAHSDRGQRISRRCLMQIGALAGAGLTLVDLLRGRASAGTPGQAQPRSVIHVLLAGGPSHFETFDPKPEAPVEVRGPYASIATSNPALRICETLPKLAQQAQRYSIIRSCCHDNPGHGGGQRYVLTGYKSASLESELPHDYPAVGAITSRVRGSMRAGMPNFLVMGGAVDGLPAFLGPAYSPLLVYSTGKPIGLELTPSMKLTRLDDRRGLRQALDTMRRMGESAAVMDAMDSLERQAYEMLTSTAAHDAFDYKKESERTRERYGDHEAGRTCLLARRFVEAGAGFVTIRLGQWDHHGNAGGTITSGMQQNAPPFDQAVSTLIEDLAERGLSEQVLVLAWGEFGRSPRINQFVGRDHWPQAMSVLLAGGGLQMGRIVGATNSKGEYPVDAIVSPADVLATVYRQLQIDVRQSFLDNTGRPIPILSHGSPIAELI